MSPVFHDSKRSFSLGFISFMAMCCLSGYAQTNVALGKSATASSSWNSTPADAFDGIHSNQWNAGSWPVRWIAVDLGCTFDVTSIHLRVEQLPDGNTTHKIYFSADGINWGLPVDILSGFTVDNQVLISTAGGSTRYIMVETTVSPSWVAWNEIEVFASGPNFYADADGDGFGDPTTAVQACTAPSGYVADNSDLCPNDPGKSNPGICGCGVSDTDTDDDGTADCNDGCPADPDKTAPGQCGCGTTDLDSDCDGISDCNDLCPGGDDSVDNNHDGKPDCKYPPSLAEIIDDWKCGNNKVLVCHKGKNSLCVAYSALAAHIAHGDYLGTCGDVACIEELNGIKSGGMLPLTTINSSYEKDEMSLYPNPAQSELQVVLASFDGPVQLEVFNALGQRVLSLRDPMRLMGESGIRLQVGSLKGGLYFLKASAAGFQEVKSFIKSE